MKITLFTVGKRNESWIEPGIQRFSERLRAPFATEMILIPHSSAEELTARQEESKRLLARLRPDDFVILLDERGRNLSSPEFSQLITNHMQHHIILIIGGAFGVTDEVRQRANVIWSLSRAVFPHQLVRLLLFEQLYRAQEIAKGGGYHHI